jgi:hypothetical protein
VVGRDANKVSPIVVDPGCQVELKQNDIDYATAKFQLIALSERLSRLPSTVKSQKIEYQKMMLEMSGSAPIEVVNIDDSNMFMGKVNDFEVPKGVKSGKIFDYWSMDELLISCRLGLGVQYSRPKYRIGQYESRGIERFAGHFQLS